MFLHCNNDHTKAPQCYVIRTLLVLFYHHFLIAATISTRLGRAAWKRFYTTSEPTETDTRYEYKVLIFVTAQFTFELYVAGPTILALKLLLFTSVYGAIYKLTNG